MAITIYRASELYNTPSRRGQPGKRGIFNVGKSTFYEEIEPELERVKLGERAIGYTGRSVDKKIENSIAAATAERDESTPRRGTQCREVVS
jgi:hypothetical protein